MTNFCFDIDDTICSARQDKQYLLHQPLFEVIRHINSLYEAGHHITFYTARGSLSGVDWYEKTRKQLEWWGVKYHKLLLGKPSYDVFIDDKAINAEDYRREYKLNRRVGVITGQFDVIHPGYIELIQDAQNVCDYLTVLLQDDASIERPEKISPLLSLEERKKILLSIKGVDEIITYRTEEDLYNILKNIQVDVRILGDDYLLKNEWTGSDLGIPVYYHKRKTGWSSTSYKTAISKQIIKRDYDEDIDE